MEKTGKSSVTANDIVSSKPDRSLNGYCNVVAEGMSGRRQCAFHSIGHARENSVIEFRSREATSWLDIKNWNHVGFSRTQTQVLIHTNPGGIMITIYPDDFSLWEQYAALWISYVRQIPLWQVLLPEHATDGVARSWGYRRTPMGDWDRVFFVLRGFRLCYFHTADAKKADDPLGLLDVAGKRVHSNDPGHVTIGTAARPDEMTILFETAPLARCWIRALSQKKEWKLTKKNKQVHNKGALYFFLVSKMDNNKKHNMSAIDVARAEYRPRRRTSLGEISDDDDE